MRAKLLFIAVIAALFSATLPASNSSAAAAPLESAAERALEARVRTELKVFTDWLASQQVGGYIGEVGWPNDAEGEAERWNALAEAWFADADAAGLWVTAWDAGQRRCEYRLAIYKTASCGRAPLIRSDTQAPVFEAHPSTERYLRGINVAGGASGAPYENDRVSPFSNRTPGLHGRDYVYDEQSTFDFLAARGTRLIRLPFRWERLQPNLGQPFDAAELGRLREAVARAGRAGLVVILEAHNYGAYYHSDGAQGVMYTIGSPEVTVEHFADLWRRVSVEFKHDPAVIGYGLMNEPHGMGARVWEQQSQIALDAIRDGGDDKLVAVPGYVSATPGLWTRYHPRAWIVDPADNVRYEAHHYFDRESWGTYTRTFETEAAYALARGFGSLARQ